MKIRILLAIIAILSFGGIVFLMTRSQEQSSQHPAGHDAHSASTQPQARRVPAYQDTAQLGSLPATLPATQFFGKAREAYVVAKEIPATLAQLPCYCECDRGYGHKSLHTCFVDDHASHCAVCVDEALLAYKLQREEKLTPEQVRARIIEKFSKL